MLDIKIDTIAWGGGATLTPNTLQVTLSMDTTATLSHLVADNVSRGKMEEEEWRRVEEKSCPCQLIWRL